MAALGRGGMALERIAGPRRPIEQFATAIRAMLVERIGAVRAEGAFERADERAGLVRRKIDAAAFAVGAHVEHDVGL